MPYEPDKCTFTESCDQIGRQQVYACLTCFKNPRNKGQHNGVCYSCSIQCHGDHDLVELFTKRNFTCDCGTTRMESAGGCNLRKNFDSLDPPESVNNIYSHNFEGRFCDCDESFVPEEQKGTMFQCLLGDVCYEDWYHEECILGLPVGSIYKGEQKPVTSTVYPQGENMLDKLESAADLPDDNSAATYNKTTKSGKTSEDKAKLEPGSEERNIEKDDKKLKEANESTEAKDRNQVKELQPEVDKDEEGDEEEEDDDPDNETLPGLPNVDQFDSFICWKCTEKHRPVIEELVKLERSSIVAVVPHGNWKTMDERNAALKKRSAEDESEITTDDGEGNKKLKMDKDSSESNEDEKKQDQNQGQEILDGNDTTVSKVSSLPPVIINSKYPFSLFLAPHFKIKLKKALSSSSSKVSIDLKEFLLTKFPFMLEEENVYEPPEDDDAHSSLLEAGARALNSIPRQQALKGLEAYEMIKQRLSDFFKPFAEEGRVVTEDDVNGFFQHMDEEKRMKKK